jgi:hypothetical protein
MKKKRTAAFSTISQGKSSAKTKKSLPFWDVNMNYLAEPGEFEIMVGSPRAIRICKG